MRRLFLLLALTITIAGCASSRVIYPHNLENKNDYSEIIVYRKSMVMGSSLLTHLSIDGIPTAEFFGNEYVSVKINTGEHLITTTNAVNVSIAERRLFSSNEKYYFDATYERRTDTGVLPEVVSQLAMKKVTKMKQVK